MPGPDLALLLEAAAASGAIAARHWGKAPAVWEKADGLGPVSAADLEIDAMLKAELLAARPDYGWLSEESEVGDRLEAERVFIVDPIDGTRAFLGRQKGFSHALAVAEKGRVVAGVVHLPMLDQTYAAEEGGGAVLNGRPIQASAREALDGARVLANAAQLAPELWPGGAPAVERHSRPSVAHRLVLAAEGRFDAAFTFRDTWEWDCAAGDVIAREAGATVTAGDGRPARFNKALPLLHGVIVAGAALHAEIVRRR